jgi:hypothetical protein
MVFIGLLGSFKPSTRSYGIDVKPAPLFLKNSCIAASLPAALLSLQVRTRCARLRAFRSIRSIGQVEGYYRGFPCTGPGKLNPIGAEILFVLLVILNASEGSVS